MSERSSRSSAESRCQGRVRQYCIWPVVDAVSEHSIGTLMRVVVGVEYVRCGHRRPRGVGAGAGVRDLG